jgi:hypothetical protein
MKINVTKDFNYFFSIRDHGQGRTLTVYSQYLGAKNPEEYQYKTQLTLQPEDWNRVAEIIRSDTMKWTELFWDNSLSVFENLATWALGVIMFTLFYIILVLVLAFA